jgi:hypothetical protein
MVKIFKNPFFTTGVFVLIFLISACSSSQIPGVDTHTSSLEKNVEAITPHLNQVCHTPEAATPTTSYSAKVIETPG